MPNFKGAGPDQREPSWNLCKAIVLGILLELVSPATHSQDFEASAFVLRNHSPFSAIIGLPGRWPDGTGNPAELSWNVSNHSFFEDNGSENLLLDGETQTISARLQHRFWPRLQIGAEIPWLLHSGGFLDGAIDAWHDLTGLSEGIRPQLPKNDLQYVFAVNSVEVFRLDDSTSGIGDIMASIAIELGRLDKPATAGYLRRMPWTLKLTAEAPTGDIDKLTGNSDWDFATGLGVRSPATKVSPLTWWVDAGVAWPGDVDIGGLDPSGQIFFYDVALAWRVYRRFDVLAQVAGNSAYYQSDIKMLGNPAAQLAVGLLWHVANNYGLRFGIIEDISSNTAPDLGFEITLLFKAFGKN